MCADSCLHRFRFSMTALALCRIELMVVQFNTSEQKIDGSRFSNKNKLV